jgi:nitrate/TMAO reductase-like tetraheme cytochrome c subunit
MFGRILRFWRVLSTSALGAAGVVLTTSGFVLFIIAELLRVAGVVTNAYVGLITYMALPAMFMLGLFLIPVGWWRLRRKTGKTTKELLSKGFADQDLEGRPLGSRVVLLVLFFTGVNVLFLGIGGARMLQFMDEPRFCGTACHSVMGPEWAAYQASPHARVRCVDCHVGEGAGAAVDAKLNGLWQMISVTFDLYERPIPAPVHNLRPARETCEKCHWPEAFYGNRVKRIVRYEDDRDSTPSYSTLSMKIGSGTARRASRRAGSASDNSQIHWHVGAENTVRYQSVDFERTAMQWVEVKDPEAPGGWRRFSTRTESAQVATDEPIRTMDCIDCHNRATHIYQDPEDAVDEAITAGEIPRSLPFAKRAALAALTTRTIGAGASADTVEKDLRSFYQFEHPEVIARHATELDRAVATLRGIFEQNIHESMNVLWNPYPDHIGHRTSPGCRRCHNPDMVDVQGQAIRSDCTLCHSMLAYESPSPFHFLDEPKPTDPEAKMHRHLRREFLGDADRLEAEAKRPGPLPLGMGPRPDARPVDARKNGTIPLPRGMEPRPAQPAPTP